MPHLEKMAAVGERKKAATTGAKVRWSSGAIGHTRDGDEREKMTVEGKKIRCAHTRCFIDRT